MDTVGPRAWLLPIPRACSHLCHSRFWGPFRWWHLDSRNPPPRHSLPAHYLERRHHQLMLSEREKRSQGQGVYKGMYSQSLPPCGDWQISAPAARREQASRRSHAFFTYSVYQPGPSQLSLSRGGKNAFHMDVLL